ncbi:MAG: molybdate ABC transporter substrate-binding protein [Acidimicrobiales bacterium]
MRRAVSVVLAVAALGGAACGGDDGASGSPSGPAAISGTVTVLAAASLTEAFERVATAFEADHPEVEVAVTFDGSSALATQILEGVPADVFASADGVSVAKVVDGGAAAGPVVPFATSSLEIAVPRGNPLGIEGLADLTSDLRLALCAPEVPCGRYAAEAFAKAGLEVPPASAEENVRGVLTKVALGEADAGIVYVTDVRASTDVEGVDLPAAHQVSAVYPAVVLADAPNPAAADAFVDFLLSTRAQRILVSHGFRSP